VHSIVLKDIITPNKRPKPFWGFVKSKMCDNNGVAPLIAEDGLVYGDPSGKADILN